MTVVALQPCWYRGKIHAVGEQFSAEVSDAKILTALGKVMRAESPADEPRPKRRYRRRDLEPEV